MKGVIVVSVLLFCIASISGIVSYNAQSALPGDALYPFKVSVNERVEGYLATSDAAKASLDLSILGERLAEAESLAKHGQLDARGQTDVTDTITAQVNNLTAILDRLQAQGQASSAATIASTLYTTLNAEAAGIADTSALGSNNLQISLAPVLVKLRTTIATVALISTKAQAQAAHLEPVPSDAALTSAQ